MSKKRSYIESASVLGTTITMDTLTKWLAYIQKRMGPLGVALETVAPLHDKTGVSRKATRSLLDLIKIFHTLAPRKYGHLNPLQAESDYLKKNVHVIKRYMNFAFEGRHSYDAADFNSITYLVVRWLYTHITQIAYLENLITRIIKHDVLLEDSDVKLLQDMMMWYAKDVTGEFFENETLPTDAVASDMFDELEDNPHGFLPVVAGVIGAAAGSIMVANLSFNTASVAKGELDQYANAQEKSFQLLVADARRAQEGDPENPRLRKELADAQGALDRLRRKLNRV